jgi:putative protease
MMEGEKIGEVTHFYNRICVGVIELSGDIKIGDMIHFLGRSTDFRQEVESIQIEHEPVGEASAGTEVAVQVERRVRKGDKVFKLTENAG